jgi:hypothetical protein
MPSDNGADTTRDDVGSEGGSPGNVEVVHDQGHGVGSEAAETWRPSDDKTRTITRDETGEGRRSP